ncbi:MAG: hypothetical protein AB1791_20855 [Chloroflexota bacterium]
MAGLTDSSPSKTYWWRAADKTPAGCQTPHPRPGQPCPQCQQGILNYDNLFLLTCNHCGYIVEGSTFT